jgi:hypothetical protein
MVTEPGAEGSAVDTGVDAPPGGTGLFEDVFAELPLLAHAASVSDAATAAAAR